jgi:release factor glutamine methyltransferase
MTETARSEASVAIVVARLRAGGCVFAEDEARILVAAAADPASLEQLVLRRVAGEPLEYIVGAVEFGGLQVSVMSGVFVPRQRSLLLVEVASELVGPTATILDLCCGSAALAAVLAARLPDAAVVAADIDPVAVACAEINLAGRGQVYRGDLFDPLPSTMRGGLDIVVCNAPYVPTAAIATMPPEAREYEPQATLDGGADGLDLLRRVAAAAPQWMARPSHLVMEVGERQIDTAQEIFAGAGFAASVRRDDDRGAIAVVGSRY